MSVLTVGDLELELRGSARRRSLQLTVDRNGELILFAPSECSPDRLSDFVQEKRFWIYGKLAEKELVRVPPASKEYVTGEGFPYLGRSHRLQLVDDQRVPVKLERGRFKMLRSAAPNGERHMASWYRTRGEQWLRARVGRLASRVGTQPASVTIRELGYRWGSCGKGGMISFHWRTVMLPPRIVDYIVVHELAHLAEAHHGPAFWGAVERGMPDFAARKQWLVEHGAQAIAL
jgi:predicted metal-dependent hydrolase